MLRNRSVAVVMMTHCSVQLSDEPTDPHNPGMIFTDIYGTEWLTAVGSDLCDQDILQSCGHTGSSLQLPVSVSVWHWHHQLVQSQSSRKVIGNHSRLSADDAFVIRQVSSPTSSLTLCTIQNVKLNRHLHETVLWVQYEMVKTLSVSRCEYRTKQQRPEQTSATRVLTVGHWQLYYYWSARRRHWPHEWSTRLPGCGTAFGLSIIHVWTMYSKHFIDE